MEFDMSHSYAVRLIAALLATLLFLGGFDSPNAINLMVIYAIASALLFFSLTATTDIIKLKHYLLNTIRSS